MKILCMFTMFTISHAYYPPPPAHPPEPPYVPYPTGRDTINSYIASFGTNVRQVQFDKTTNCIYFMGKGYNVLELYRTNITSGVTVLINSVNNYGEPTALAISYTHMKLFIAIGRKITGQGTNTLYHVSLPANNGDYIYEKIASMSYDVNGMYAIGDYLYFSYSEYEGDCVTRTTIDPPTTDGFGSGCFQNINDAIAVASNNDDTLYVLSGKERSVYKVNLTDSSSSPEIVISSIYSSAYPTMNMMGTMAVSQTTIYIQLTNELLMYDVNSFRLLRRITEDYMSIAMGSYDMFYGSITFNEENLVFLGAAYYGILQLNFNEGPSPPPLPPSAPPLPPSLEEIRIKTLEDQVAELQSLIVNSTGTCGDLRRIYAESACCGLDDSASITCASS